MTIAPRGGRIAAATVRALAPARELFEKIREPRTLKLVTLAAYVVATYTGIVTLIMPPSSIEGVLGVWLTIFWSIFILFGGVAGAIGVLPGWWWLERLAVYGICFGLTIYGSVVLALHFASTGSRLTQLGIITLAGVLMSGRWVQIRGFNFEPRG